MKNLFEPAASAELTERISRLAAESPRQWGTMTPAQALAHLANSIEFALGDKRPPRLLAGRLFGRLVKKFALGDEKPFRRNTPTDPALVISDARDLEIEKQRLLALVSRAASGGPSAATTHPHPFFGRLTPEEWGVLMYKHADHHLRQFGG